jgi:hypothetical protein
MIARLAGQVERWEKYWRAVIDPAEVERELRRLRWFEEFVFHCGAEISREHYEALQRQIEAGELKLTELGGDVSKTLIPERSQLVDTTTAAEGDSDASKTCVFETREVAQ